MLEFKLEDLVKFLEAELRRDPIAINSLIQEMISEINRSKERGEVDFDKLNEVISLEREWEFVKMASLFGKDIGISKDDVEFLDFITAPDYVIKFGEAEVKWGVEDLSNFHKPLYYEGYNILNYQLNNKKYTIIIERLWIENEDITYPKFRLHTTVNI